MNAYTTRGQARVQQRDLATILQTNTGSYMAAVSLAGLERQRSWQAESEVEWQLTQNGGTPQAHTPVVVLLRQRIGAVLVRASGYLPGAARGDDRLVTNPAGTPGPAG
jgi:hypothetical protein